MNLDVPIFARTEIYRLLGLSSPPQHTSWIFSPCKRHCAIFCLCQSLEVLNWHSATFFSWCRKHKMSRKCIHTDRLIFQQKTKKQNCNTWERNGKGNKKSLTGNGKWWELSIWPWKQFFFFMWAHWTKSHVRLSHLESARQDHLLPTLILKNLLRIALQRRQCLVSETR